MPGHDFCLLSLNCQGQMFLDFALFALPPMSKHLLVALTLVAKPKPSGKADVGNSKIIESCSVTKHFEEC